MRVLFLDVDGVLNSYRTYYSIGCGYSGMMDRGEDPRFDPIAVELLRTEVEQHKLSIVLSSTWRLGYTVEALQGIWHDTMTKHYNWIDFPLIGATPDLGKSRGEEIQMWCSLRDVEDYVILDDDPDMLPEQLPNFYRCNTFVGIDAGFHEWMTSRYNPNTPRFIA